MDFGDALAIRGFPCAAGEGNGRPSKRIIQDFDLSPGHRAPAETERLHDGLFSGKARGEPLASHTSMPGTLRLGSREHAADKAFAPSRERLLYA